MKRDLYAEVSARIIAELEAGAAPWIKPWSATAGSNTPCNAATNRPYSGCNVVLLWMAANAGYRTPRYLTFKQALELGGNVRKGEHGTKVYFVKQLHVADRDSEEGETRIVPMMREYTVFNVDQCENLPDSVKTGKRMRVRNPDTHDALADEFLRSTSADIREGHGEALEFFARANVTRPDRHRAPLRRGFLVLWRGPRRGSACRPGQAPFAALQYRGHGPPAGIRQTSFLSRAVRPAGRNPSGRCHI
jgi:antirestriction protein ArdC